MKVKNIQKIKTVDGHMIPIYRDWDHSTNEGHKPQMVYATAVDPKIRKDIILHQKRTSYMTCIQGIVKIDLMKDDVISTVLLDAEKDNEINMVIIEPGIPIQIENLGENRSIIINCPSPAWHPDDQDTLKFKDWREFKEWKLKD